MRQLPLLLSVLGACGLPHVDPLPRTDDQSTRTTVQVASWCAMKGGAYGTGVVMSEDRIITAGHVTSCPDFPTVIAMVNGRAWTLIEDRNDLIFGDGTDLASLRTAGALDRFGLGVAPPVIGPDPGYNDVVCAQTLRGRTCGPLVGMGVLELPTRHGDSGAPIYDLDGRLVGIVVSGDEDERGTLDSLYTGYVGSQLDWLEGT